MDEWFFWAPFNDLGFHITYLSAYFQLVCVLVSLTMYCFCFLHEFLIEMYIYIQWFCELLSQAFEIRKNK